MELCLNILSQVTFGIKVINALRRNMRLAHCLAILQQAVLASLLNFFISKQSPTVKTLRGLRAKLNQHRSICDSVCARVFVCVCAYVCREAARAYWIGGEKPYPPFDQSEWLSFGSLLMPPLHAEWKASCFWHQLRYLLLHVLLSSSPPQSLPCLSSTCPCG